MTLSDEEKKSPMDVELATMQPKLLQPNSTDEEKVASLGETVLTLQLADPGTLAKSSVDEPKRQYSTAAARLVSKASNLKKFMQKKLNGLKDREKSAEAVSDLSTVHSNDVVGEDSEKSPPMSNIPTHAPNFSGSEYIAVNAERTSNDNHVVQKTEKLAEPPDQCYANLFFQRDSELPETEVVAPPGQENTVTAEPSDEPQNFHPNLVESVSQDAPEEASLIAAHTSSPEVINPGQEMRLEEVNEVSEESNWPKRFRKRRTIKTEVVSEDAKEEGSYQRKRNGSSQSSRSDSEAQSAVSPEIAGIMSPISLPEDDQLESIMPSGIEIQPDFRVTTDTAMPGFRQSHLAVRIARTDKLPASTPLVNLLVRMSIVDGATGKPLRIASRLVARNDNEKSGSDIYTTHYTEAFGPAKTSAIPVWDKVFPVEGKLAYLKDKEAIMFFEVVRYRPSNGEKNLEDVKFESQPESSFKPIAWAFIKLSNTSSLQKIISRFRLQLFFPEKQTLPPNHHHFSSDVLPPYRWWEQKQLTKYPSSLYVEFESSTEANTEQTSQDMAVTSPTKKVTPENNSTYSEQFLLGIRDLSNERKRSIRLDHVSRTSAVGFQVPDTVRRKINTGSLGSSCIRFSNNGRYFACAGYYSSGIHTVDIFEFPSQNLLAKLEGFRRIIYDLDWSEDDSYIIGASADCTANVWETVTFTRTAVCTLPHPAFVYCAKFQPNNNEILVTACYDGVIRRWHVDYKTYNFKLVHEISAHRGPINALLFGDNTLISGGSDGCVREWNISTWENTGAVQLSSDVYDLHRVASRTSTPKILAITQVGQIVHLNFSRPNRTWMYQLPASLKHRIQGCLSPSREFLFIGGYNAEIQVYDTNLRYITGIISTANYESYVMSITVHPFENSLACCIFERGPNIAIVYHEGPKDKPVQKSGFLLAETTDEKIEEKLSKTPFGEINEILQKMDQITVDLERRRKNAPNLKSGKNETRNPPPVLAIPNDKSNASRRFIGLMQNPSHA